jgi:thiol-disulfide isomerase/thioredoxin
MLKALCGAVCAATLIALSSGAYARNSTSLGDWAEGGKPGLALTDVSATRHDLDSLKGRVVLVHFWATWCEPCIPELTALNKLAEIYSDRPVSILAVNVGEVDARVRRFLEKLPLSFPVVLDRDRAVTKSWDVYALPTTFVLDDTLKPRLYAFEDVDWTSPEIARHIDALLPPKK